MPQPLFPGSFNANYGQFQDGFGVGIIKDKFQAILDAAGDVSPPLLTYPIDLGNSAEDQFMIRFDIRETGGASLNNTRSVQNFAVDLTKLGASEDGVLGALKQVGGFAAAAISPAVDALLAGSGGTKGSGLSETSKFGKGRDSFVEESLGIGNLTNHVASLYMYLPGNIAIGYKFEYEDADLSGMDILKGLRSLTETSGAGAAAQAAIARKIGMSALSAADSVTELIGGKDTLINSIKSSSRQVENPFVVHMFKGVGRRTFKFTFSMIPRSEKEAVAIDNITTMFRKYAHPKRAEGGRFLDFPAEFSISFLHKQNESIRMPKIRKCALAGINLNYGENTFTTTKADANGMVTPTKIVMELEFEELEILTQQSITEQGA